MNEAAYLLDIRAVASVLGVAETTVRSLRHKSYVGYQANPFPEPVAIIGGSPAWTREQIEEWQAGRVGRGNGARTQARRDGQLRRRQGERKDSA